MSGTRKIKSLVGAAKSNALTSELRIDQEADPIHDPRIEDIPLLADAGSPRLGLMRAIFFCDERVLVRSGHGTRRSGRCGSINVSAQ